MPRPLKFQILIFALFFAAFFVVAGCRRGVGRSNLVKLSRKNMKVACSAKILKNFSSKMAKVGKNSFRIHRFPYYSRKFFHQAGLISTLFSCFWGFAYSCPPPGGGGGASGRNIYRCDSPCTYMYE